MSEKSCNKAEGLISRKLLTRIILKVLSLLLFFDIVLGLPSFTVEVDKVFVGIFMLAHIC